MTLICLNAFIQCGSGLQIQYSQCHTESHLSLDFYTFVDILIAVVSCNLICSYLPVQAQRWRVLTPPLSPLSLQEKQAFIRIHMLSL